MNIDDPVSGQGATAAGSSRLTFSVTTSLQDELDGFVRYSRLGLFQKAQEVYGDVLDGPYDRLFPVTAELADSLLEQGNFRRLSAFLESRLRQAPKLGFEESQVGLLSLSKAITDIHRSGDLWSALRVARSWREAAAVSMIPDRLSVVDTLSLTAYLRIVTIASKTSNWLQPQDMQPPWESGTTEPWSGFCQLFTVMSGDPEDAWNARSLFRPLSNAVTPEKADELYSAWRSKRQEAAPDADEEGLLADLCITTTYARKQSAGVVPTQLQNRTSRLLEGSQRLLDKLTMLITEVDDLTDIRIRAALDLDLAKLETITATRLDNQNYDSFHDSCKQIWLVGGKNHDFVTQKDSLRLQRLSVALGYMSDSDFPGILPDQSGDMLGYVTAMTHRILSVSQEVTELASSSPPEKERTKLNPATRETFRDRFSHLLNQPWAIESFEMWLDSTAMTTPLIQFTGSVARLILAELLDGKWEIENCKKRILAVVDDIRWPLHRMVDTGYLAGVQLLLEIGVSPNAKDSYEATPLLNAIKGRNTAIVRLLLSSGANINAEDSDGRTAMSWASIKGQEGLVRLLLSTGANVDSADNGGRTPLTWAAMKGHVEVVRLLLARGAKFDSRDMYDTTPLSNAARQGHKEVVSLLLDKGANVDPWDRDGCTPLSDAARDGHGEVVRLLLDTGAMVDAKNYMYHQTPLRRAAKHGQEGVVRLLLARGADVNSQCVEGRTPLLDAARNGYLSVVMMLLDRGADINAKDTNGKTALSLALEKGHREVVGLLLEAGQKGPSSGSALPRIPTQKKEM